MGDTINHIGRERKRAKTNLRAYKKKIRGNPHYMGRVWIKRKDGMKMYSRKTKVMIKNFLKLRTGDEELQNKIADVLDGALPKMEPKNGYDEVAQMLAALTHDFARADPLDDKARMAIMRDHADALFIDGLVYGAYLATRSKEK